MHRPRDEAGPAGLMARANARAVVALEILVEEQTITPVRVLLESLIPAKHRAASVGIAEKRRAQSSADLLSHLEERHPAPGPCRALDRELRAVVAIVLKEPANDQDVDREPHRSAPVRVAAKHARVRLGG